ncbi:uncharacterized protein LODBEIA_P51390 [Lodderomyces beijingensis]|uniref:Uncharacterized protein n=1 Tax=Lodderomyces beijingensis TaxID=1775926 RepID=A0ABP0ZRY9_9ASCO
MTFKNLPPSYQESELEFKGDEKVDISAKSKESKAGPFEGTTATVHHNSADSLLVRDRELAICKTDTYTFVSEDAWKMYEKSLKSKNDHLRMSQQNGIGIPVLKGEFNAYASSAQFMEFYAYKLPEFGSFNFNNDYFHFCAVKRLCRPAYDCFVFTFTPDREDPKQNFSFTMFSHAVHPINDYKYKGEIHRWVDESKNSCNLEPKKKRGLFFSKASPETEFRHTILDDNQPSLVDSWDGKGTKLDMNSSKNPLLKPQYGKLTDDQLFYGRSNIGNCTRETKGKPAILKICDAVARKDLDPECVASVGLEALVSACVAKVLLTNKKYIDNDKKRNYQLAKPELFD